MSSVTSSETQSNLIDRARKAGLSRWKLETLTGLLGYRALAQHQSETAKNMAVENRHVRKQLWGDDGAEQAEGEDMGGHTILGDVTHPTPIVIGQQSGSGIGKLLAGLALGTLIPAAGVGGFLASQLMRPAPPVTQPTEDETVDIGLGRITDLDTK